MTEAWLEARSFARAILLAIVGICVKFFAKVSSLLSSIFEAQISEDILCQHVLSHWYTFGGFEALFELQLNF